MSRWRERGFVQDSDEEEDDFDAISPVTTPSSPKTRDASPLLRPTAPNVDWGHARNEQEDSASPGPEAHFQTPDLDNVTPVAVPPPTDTADAVARDRSESPDPLQATYERDRPVTKVQEPDVTVLDTRAEDVSILDIDQSDDSLSDPPSDLDDQPPALFSPNRRQTVHVVIPAPLPLTAPLREYIPEQIRTFRERKPIQLHPYALEQERFRQDCLRRGIKPPPRPHSPSRHQHHDAEETQEKDYEPDNESPANSQADLALSTSNHHASGGHSRRLSSAGHVNMKEAVTDMSQPRISHTQPHVSYSAGRKRQKLRHLHPPTGMSLQESLMQLYRENGIITTGPMTPAGDAWAVPLSPPHNSSSPLTSLPQSAARTVQPSRFAGNGAGASLPTPSKSSSIQGDDQAEDSDLDDIPTSTRALGRSRPVVVSSDSEAESPANRASKLGKVLKGVLPASYARYADAAQMRRKEAAKKQPRLAMSLSKDGPQRGVARPITKGSSTRSAMLLSDEETEREVIAISDESDNDGQTAQTIVTPLSANHQTSAQQNLELAALFDSRYHGEDISDMEDDSLDLFARGTGDRVGKRKRQSTLADSFHRTKRPRHDGVLLPSKATRTIRPAGQARRKETRPRKPKRPTPPTLSVVDVDFRSRNTSPLPQFMRVAVRQARRRPDLGRQSPTQKHVRLHTFKDTADATTLLQQWRRGALKPKVMPKPPAKRPPLVERHKNGHFPALSAAHKEGPVANQQHTRPEVPPATLRNGSEHDTAPIVFTRTLSERGYENPSTDKPNPTQEKPPRQLARPHPSLRPAQLEGLESDFGRNPRTLQFQRGLQLAEKNFSLGLLHQGPALNIPLAKFLADEDNELSPRIVAERGAERLPRALQHEEPETPRARRRVLRKQRAQRIDVDTREYRQPAEPALGAYLSNNTPAREESAATNVVVLEGLGPSGSAYPATFDVLPLDIGTYFHPETFIGSGEMEKALSTSKRDLDEFGGTCNFQSGALQFGSDSWDDATYSQVSSIFEALNSSGEDHQPPRDAAKTLRHVIKYVARYLSFLDPVDRQDFASKLTKLLDTQLTNLLRYHVQRGVPPDNAVSHHRKTVQPLSYLLVLTVQVYQVARHPVVSTSLRTELQGLIEKISAEIIDHLLREGISRLSSFLEKNAIYREREAGIRDGEAFVESTVICMHVLDTLDFPRFAFWDIISRQLSATIEKATHVNRFDCLWATTFTLLPFVEFDGSGILVTKRRFQIANENWTFIKDLLKRLFELYPATQRGNRSVVEYVKATFRRCNVLLETWHWRKCDPVLTAIFDFFATNGLKDIERDGARDSPVFLQELGGRPRLSLDATDTAFQIFLKSLASGVRGMRGIYADKKIRSLVFRCTPNHGRSYPRDQSLDRESLNALRNHHDLLCTLYWASPPPARPSLGRIRDLVQHENSHTGACQLSVRAWGNLTMFQFSTDEPYSSLQPLAEWHKEILHKTWSQYRSAKIEADNYLKTIQAEGSSDISERLVRSAMISNQDKLIDTLRDCVAVLRKAVARWKDSPFMRDFLIDCDILQLLEFVHVDDPRLAVVICEALAILRDYIVAQMAKAISAEVSQPASEESQDYGEFPDLDDLLDAEHVPEPSHAAPFLDFVQVPLWKLLSNVFGTDRPPDDALLRACVDTWVQIAHAQVSVGDRAWSYYLGSFSTVSWHQLRDTEQTRKYKPYFMAAICESDPFALPEYRTDFFSTLLVSLVERESLLKFQDRLLLALVQANSSSPLLEDLPYYRDDRTNQMDINFSTLKERRRALLSRILANMQQEMLRTRKESPDQYNETKSEYAALLHDMMMAMKHNYQQLRQGSTATSAYVDFVQHIVQFLTQYTADVCPVNPFFTDSVNFPLPTGDPTYVVGRLCGYAPKLAVPGATKQLAMFIHTVAQQAAHDNKGDFLLSQLTTALTEDKGSSRTKSALRHVLLQGIFPAYVEHAFASSVGMVIAKPILQALEAIFATMFFELRMMEAASVEDFCNSSWSIFFAFIKATDHLKAQPQLISQPYILRSMGHVLDTLASALPTLQYIATRSSPDPQMPDFVRYVRDFAAVVARVLGNSPPPHSLPAFEPQDLPVSPNADLLSFCTRELHNQVKANWTESMTGSISFGHGYAKRDVLFDIGTFAEERLRFQSAYEAFDAAVAYTYDPDGNAFRRRHEARTSTVFITPMPVTQSLPSHELPVEDDDSVFSFDEDNMIKEEPASSFSFSYLNV